MKFCLFFSGQHFPELVSTAFIGPCGETLTALRGYGFHNPKGLGSFPWSTSVHSLAILALRAKLFRAPHLSGNGSSPATSLDYAIAKQPAWLRDLFGNDESGTSLIRHLVVRANSHGKRPGPVEVTWRDPSQLEIYWEDTLVSDYSALQKLLQQLEFSWGNGAEQKPVKTLNHPSPFISDRDLRTQDLADSFQSEIATSLVSCDIFSPEAEIAYEAKLRRNPEFFKLSGCHNSIFSHDVLSSPSTRLGIANKNWLRRELCQDTPIRIASAISSAGSNALFHYLRNVKGYNIEIDHNFIHALDIGNRILAKDPYVDHDLCVIASAPAGALLAQKRRHDYLPLMFLPTSSIRVVAPKVPKKRRLSTGRFSFLVDRPSTASFYFEDLNRLGFLQKKKSAVSHHEPFETARELALGDEDLKAVLFFPYYSLNILYNNCSAFDLPHIDSGNAPMILFARRNSMQHRSRILALNIAIRSAWLDLKFAPNKITHVTDKMLNSSQFLTILSRCAGSEFMRNPGAQTVAN